MTPPFFKTELIRGGDAEAQGLFCLPGAGGQTGIFSDMASLISEKHCIYGVNMEMFFESEQPFTVEQAAAVCIEAVTKAQRRGPYFLCGYSFGAVVAYEAARQFESRGEEVRCVALIDTGNTAYGRALSPADRANSQKAYLANRLSAYGQVLLKGEVKILLRVVGAKLASRADGRARRVVKKALAAFNRPMPELLRNNNKLIYQALRAYEPAGMSSPLLLYYEASRQKEFGGDPTLGWANCAKASVLVERATAGHVDLMKAPHVKAFAARLSGLLNESAPAV